MHIAIHKVIIMAMKAFFLLALASQCAEAYYLETLSCMEGQNITEILSSGFQAVDRYNSKIECTTVTLFCQGDHPEITSFSLKSVFCSER